MFDNVNEIPARQVKYDGEKEKRGISFKKIRTARKKNRLKRNLEKSLSLKSSRLATAVSAKPFPGPTEETRAKLTPDPLALLARKNILNDQQIWAFKRIRHAVKVITDGTQVRISRFSAAAVQSSRFCPRTESEYEIRIKEYYTNWIDRMTGARLQAGPVLDIILDEMSLNAVDRKWGKRKGWAKGHLQASLELYGAFSRSYNRNE